MRNSLKAAFLDVFVTSQSYKNSARLGALTVPFIMTAPAMAQGLVRGFSNLSTLTQMGIGLLIAIGMLGGLGFILGACFSLYKKYDRGNDDVSWGKVAMQFCAGGLGMALSWVGVQIVETLGGSSSDIGRRL